ncbi:MAG: Flp pilus assembly protein CpaB [Rhodoferax sp.]|nr:Flp pilus assembly protein CpaB [Rhodoferax sp.]
MKSKRALIMIATALLAGLVAVWFAYRWVGHMAESTTTVVVAARDVDPGMLLTEASLQTIAWPSDALPSGALTDEKKAVGRVAGTAIFKGEPILEVKLAQPGATGGLSAVLAPGKRAISIQANEIAGVAGYVHPGSRVDIMVNTREFQEKQISKIILTNILVLAAAQDDKRDQTKPKVVSTVTLEVDPQQAEIVDLARSIGTLSMVLRNPLDTAPVQTVGVTRDDVFGTLAQRAAAPVVIAAARPSTETVGVQPKARAVVKVDVSPAPAPAPVVEAVEIIRGVQKAVSNY